MRNSSVYLDYNATAPLRLEAQEAMTRVWGRVGNASSVHSFGRRARLVVEDARAQVAGALGGEIEEVVFTSGGTESNVLSIKGYGAGAGALLISSTAHDSVLKNALQAAGHRSLVMLPVTPSGVLDLSAMEENLARSEGAPFVSVEWVNSETGVVQPVEEIVALVRRYGGVVHVDAVQALGRVAVDAMRGDDRPDLVSLSAHKIGGPQGVGALVVRDGFGQRAGWSYAPLFDGGGQEKGRRSGTENVAGVAGFGAAVDCAVAKMVTDVPRWHKWQEEFEAAVLRVDGAQVLGKEAVRVANTSCLVIEGLKAETALMRMDMAGFAVSSGSACSSGKVGGSHVLKAMAVEDVLQRSALRVSFGWGSTYEELADCAACWTEIAVSAKN